MEADLFSSDIGLASVHHFDVNQPLDLFPKNKALNVPGETPKVHLEEVFGLCNIDQRLLASLKPATTDTMLDSPAGHIKAMEDTLAYLKNESGDLSPADESILAESIALIEENVENNRLLMSYRLILLKA